MALGGRAKSCGGSALSAVPGHFYAKLSLVRSIGFLAYSVLLLMRFGTMSEAPAALNSNDIQPVKERKPEGNQKLPQAAHRTSGECVGKNGIRRRRNTACRNHLFCCIWVKQRS